MVLGNIGIVYKKQKAYDKVLEYYEKAKGIHEKVESKFGEKSYESAILRKSSPHLAPIPTISVSASENAHSPTRT